MKLGNESLLLTAYFTTLPNRAPDKNPLLSGPGSQTAIFFSALICSPSEALNGGGLIRDGGSRSKSGPYPRQSKLFNKNPRNSSIKSPLGSAFQSPFIPWSVGGFQIPAATVQTWKEACCWFAGFLRAADDISPQLNVNCNRKYMSKFQVSRGIYRFELVCVEERRRDGRSLSFSWHFMLMSGKYEEIWQKVVSHQLARVFH